MKTPGDRLRAIREHRGFKNARDAARAYGWDVNTYASHENGNRGIPPDAAIRYSKVFGFSLDWLYKSTTPIDSIGVGSVPYVATKVVPRLSWEFMKEHGGVETAMEHATDFSSLPQHLQLIQPAFSMKIIGDGMKNVPGANPTFEENDEVIFSTKANIKPGDFVLAELFDENAVVFRQYRERSAKPDGFVIYELAALNPAHRSYIIDKPDQARIVAKMTHCIKAYN